MPHNFDDLVEQDENEPVPELSFRSFVIALVVCAAAVGGFLSLIARLHR
jgi:hypothetical protein